jgi:hypothetical protein
MFKFHINQVLIQALSTCGVVLALEPERGSRSGDVGVPAALADISGWLPLLPGGRVDDGACSRHSRQEMLTGFRLLLLSLAVSF